MLQIVNLLRNVSPQGLFFFAGLAGACQGPLGALRKGGLEATYPWKGLFEEAPHPRKKHLSEGLLRKGREYPTEVGPIPSEGVV